MDKAKYPLVRFTVNRSLEEAEMIYQARITDARANWERFKATFSERDCPICGSAKKRAEDSFRDTFGVDRCLACNTPYVNPVPGEEALADYYRNAESVRMCNQVLKKRSGEKKHFIADERMKVVLGLAGKWAQRQGKLNILEIGCNQGAFLSGLHRALEDSYPHLECELTGIDIDAGAVAMGEDPGVTLLHESAGSLGAKEKWQNYFGLVLCFELIEHLPDPAAFMQDAFRVLADGGGMVITTPNAGGLEIRAAGYNHYRLLSHTIFPPFHLNSFSTANITHFALRNGFNVETIETPGKLDVDLVGIYAENSSTVPDIYREIPGLSEECRGWLQALVSDLKVSSNMLVVLGKG